MSSMQIDQAPVFGRDSHVLDYWLANAEGFRVKRRGHWPARVRRVVYEPDGMRASALVVSSALTRRRRVLDAYAVVSVDPAARRLVLAGTRRARLRRALTLAAGATRRSAPRLRASVSGGCVSGWRWSQPRAAAAARTTCAHGSAAVLWLHPRALAVARTSAAATAAAAAWLYPRMAAAARAAVRRLAATRTRLAPVLSGAVHNAIAAARSGRRPGF